jgi:hypothetical protein
MIVNHQCEICVQQRSGIEHDVPEFPGRILGSSNLSLMRSRNDDRKRGTAPWMEYNGTRNVKLESHESVLTLTSRWR